MVGPVCETGDFLARDRKLANAAPGDYLAVCDGGGLRVRAVVELQLAAAAAGDPGGRRHVPDYPGAGDLRGSGARGVPCEARGSRFWLAAPAASAHDTITTKLLWTQEISRIVNRHCVSCHREGGAAMSLATYEDARPWAKAIRDEVLARRMPPWGAVKGVGEFRGDPSLSQIEIDMIVNWVEGGAPKGDEVYLPAGAAFQRGDQAAQPAGRDGTLHGHERRGVDAFEGGRIRGRAAGAARRRASRSK